LDKRLRLTSLISRTPNPPWLFSLQITSHFTQLIFFPPLTSPQRNWCWILITFFHTLTGIFIRRERK
jgi:hypothetical protein